jgi:hypothetical protein
MNPKYRLIYLVLGFAGLIVLIYHLATNLFEYPGEVLMIAIPDMILFFCAYKTYPVEARMEVER